MAGSDIIDGVAEPAPAPHESPVDASGVKDPLQSPKVNSATSTSPSSFSSQARLPDAGMEAAANDSAPASVAAPLSDAAPASAVAAPASDAAAVPQNGSGSAAPPAQGDDEGLRADAQQGAKPDAEAAAPALPEHRPSADAAAAVAAAASEKPEIAASLAYAGPAMSSGASSSTSSAASTSTPVSAPSMFAPYPNFAPFSQMSAPAPLPAQPGLADQLAQMGPMSAMSAMSAMGALGAMGPMGPMGAMNPPMPMTPFPSFFSPFMPPGHHQPMAHPAHDGARRASSENLDAADQRPQPSGSPAQQAAQQPPGQQQPMYCFVPVPSGIREAPVMYQCVPMAPGSSASQQNPAAAASAMGLPPMGPMGPSMMPYRGDMGVSAPQPQQAGGDAKAAPGVGPAPTDKDAAAAGVPGMTSIAATLAQMRDGDKQRVVSVDVSAPRSYLAAQRTYGGPSGSSAMTGTSALRPHTCNMRDSWGRQCKRTFTRPYDLLRHQETVHSVGTKVYICERCGSGSKRFSRQDSLARHIRRMHHTEPERRTSRDTPSYEIPRDAAYDESRRRSSYGTPSELLESPGGSSADAEESPRTESAPTESPRDESQHEILTRADTPQEEAARPASMRQIGVKDEAAVRVKQSREAEEAAAASPEQKKIKLAPPPAGQHDEVPLHRVESLTEPQAV